MDVYSQYDPSENDPYEIPGSTCLQNLLGLTNTADLNAAEQQITNATLADLARNPEKPTFDLDHLVRIHRRIFDQIYPFAGEIRTIDFGKGDILFLPLYLIDREATACFASLHADNLLRDIDEQDYGNQLAFYLGWLNKIHPFREGNGRTQRILIDQLAALSGFGIEWNAISGDAMGAACRAARSVQPNYHPLQKLLSINIVRLIDE